MNEDYMWVTSFRDKSRSVCVCVLISEEAVEEKHTNLTIVWQKCYSCSICSACEDNRWQRKASELGCSIRRKETWKLAPWEATTVLAPGLVVLQVWECASPPWFLSCTLSHLQNCRQLAWDALPVCSACTQCRSGAKHRVLIFSWEQLWQGNIYLDLRDKNISFKELILVK